MQLIIKEGNMTYMASFPSKEGSRPSCKELLRHYLMLSEKLYGTASTREAFYTSDPDILTASAEDPVRLAYKKYGQSVKEHLAVVDDNGSVENLEADEDAADDCIGEYEVFD